MANSIDDLLAKSSPEEQAKFKGLVQDAVTGRQTEAERNAESAQKTALRNDPTKGHEQTPEQAQNAVEIEHYPNRTKQRSSK
jgi:hypothetical protein